MMAKTKNPVSCCCWEIDNSVKNQKNPNPAYAANNSDDGKNQTSKPVEKTNPFFCVKKTKKKHRKTRKIIYSK